MTDEQGFDEDPQLRDLLGRSDPAASLTPADPQGLARLLEDTMSNDLDTRTDLPQQDTELRRRGPLAWLVAAAAVAVIAGGGFAAVSSMQGDDPAPQAGPSTAVDPVDEPETLSLALPAVPATKCAVPTPEMLAASEVAFSGTVVAINGDVVTLAPTETFAGATATEIELVGLRPGLRTLGGQPEFEVGGTYLVSATGGQVSACGFSGAATPELEQLYDLAFR